MAMKVIIQAIDQASPVIKQIDKEFGAMGDKFNTVAKQIDTDSKAMESRFGKLSEAARKIGTAMVVAGAAIVGGLTLAAKAAEDERVNIARLESQLANVGVAYADVRKELEANIAATQRKTGIADDQQRIALGDLVMITGDYKRALELLPLALDLAAAKQIDLSTAAELVGRVAEGNTGVLSRYGIVLQEGATAAEALAAMQQQVAGAAEASASQFDILKASLSDMTESIGAAVLPVITDFVKWLTAAADKIGEWAEKNPALVKTLLALGAVLVVGGSILVGLGMLSKAIIAINAALIIMQSLAGPAGWAKIAAGAAIATTAIIGMNVLLEDSANRAADAMKQADDLARQLQSTAGVSVPAPGTTPTTPSTPAAPPVLGENEYATIDDYFKARGLKIPKMAAGGLVTSPTLAMIGEAGPEAVVPLNSNFGGGSVNITLSGIFSGDEAGFRALARRLKDTIAEESRRNSFGPVNRGYHYGTSGL